MKTKLAGKRLLINIPLLEPRPSASGKTLVVATSHGLRRSGVEVAGKTLWVTVNAFCYPNELEDGGLKKVPGKREGKMQKGMVRGHENKSNRR